MAILGKTTSVSGALKRKAEALGITASEKSGLAPGRAAIARSGFSHISTGEGTPEPQQAIPPTKPAPSKSPAKSLTPSSTPTISSASASLPPVPGDLAETPEIQFTPEIIAKADALGGDAAELYRFVRNKISFEHYVGSRKGSLGALRELSGNEADQCSLLIALLRSEGIPARYVTGRVEIPAERLLSWIGAEHLEEAPATLRNAEAISDGNGGVASYKLDRT